MSFKQVITCLDKLIEYPAIVDYIKHFNSPDGFIYTIETDPIKMRLDKQMNDLLDDGSHSGASWGFMLRMIQAVLNGVTTREHILALIREEEDAVSHACIDNTPTEENNNNNKNNNNNIQ